MSKISLPLHLATPFSRLRRQFPQGGTKKVSASLPSCLPLREGAERSEAEGGQQGTKGTTQNK